jgi:hypothetical protein
MFEEDVEDEIYEMIGWDMCGATRAASGAPEFYHLEKCVRFLPPCRASTRRRQTAP